MLFKTRNPMGHCALRFVLSAVLLGLVGCAGGSSGSGSSTPGSSSPGSSNMGSTSSRSSLPLSSAGQETSSVSSLANSSVTANPIGEDAITIAPDHPKLRYTGRVHITPTAAQYDWADTRIEFRTTAAQAELLLNDTKNDYNLFVDGQLKQTISATTANSTHLVALGEGDHRVLLTKRTGPNFGAGQFLGMRLPKGGQLLDLPATPSRKIEFIGDSWTVGYGNEGPGLNCNGILRPYENAYLSFAPIAARALQAQSHSIAISGFGAVRNYGDANPTSPKPMPLYYNRTLMERDDLPWNFQSWLPNAVVIKLGTNDHSTQPEPSAEVFIQGIHGLISQVTDAYGQLPIFLVADNSLPQVVVRMQTAMQQQQQDKGNSQVYFVQLTAPPQSQLGCDWHPLVIAHEAMAAELVAAIKSTLSWETGGSTGNTGFDSVAVTPFKGGAKAAYSMVFDDYCSSWTSGIDDHAIPGLMARGLRAGLGAIASECEKNNFQARLKVVAGHGFEIINHSWSHPSLVLCATNPNPAQSCSDVRPDFSAEIDKARDFLAQATGKPVDFFVFPYNSVDDTVLNHLREQGYLGARGGSYALNGANFSDPLKLNLLGNQTDMNALADQAIAAGAFTLINLHGVADASYMPVPLDIWNAHLDYLKTLVDQHDLWVDNPTAIVKYNRTKALCGTAHLSGNTLSFSGAQPGCTAYVTGLTVSVTATAGVPDLAPMQNGSPLPTRRISANVVLVDNVDPRYPVTLN